MDGELITAIVAVVVSVVGMVYTALQARTAKAAARSAQAQVVLMRRQIEGEEKARFEGAGPVFSVSGAIVDDSNTNVPRAVLSLRQDSGPRLVSVVVGASGTGVEGMRGVRDPDSPWEYRREEQVDAGESTPGAVHDLYVDLSYDTRATDVHLTLICTTSSGERWERAAGARAEPAPEPPLRSSRRPRYGQS